MSIGTATAAANELRRKHYRAGLRTILIEGGDTNKCPRSEDLSTWTQSAGTGSRTGGQADPLGTTTAFKLDDQDATVSLNWHSANLVAYGLTYTTRGFSVYVKADTSAKGNFGVFDVTAGVYRCRFDLVNTGGVITANVEAGFVGGGHSVVAVLPSTDQPGWYRVLMAVAGLTIGNNHQVYLRPTDINSVTAVGAMIFWGVMAHDRARPAHSYIQNNTAGSTSCPNDDLQLPWLTAPGALSFYINYRETGMQGIAVDENISPRILQLANGNTQPRIIILHPAGSSQWRVQYENLSQANSTTTIGAPTLAYGDTVEVFVWLYANATAQIAVSVNGAALIYSAVGAALAGGWPAAFDPAGLVANQRVQGAGTLGSGFMEAKSFGLFPGVFTPAELQSLAGVIG